MAKIKDIKAMEILDSRGNPTIETTVILGDNTIGTASVPSGASVSSYEALELRDHDLNRYHGQGVLKAIENIEKSIKPAIVGMEASKQQEIDRAMIELDGTQNKSRLGGNAMLSVSMAVAKTAAKSAVLPLFLYLRQFVKKEHTLLKIPTPLFNVLNGGKHAGGNVDFQEFLCIPATSKTYSQSIEMGITVYEALKSILVEKGLTILVGDEGGFGPNLASNPDALSLLQLAVNKTQYRFGYDVFFGIDIAANSFYEKGSYHLKDKPMAISSSELISYYQQMLKEHPLLYIEDVFAEDDWDAWTKFASLCPSQTILVGDDLTSTNPYRLQMALDKKAITGIIIKPNQIGTVIEAMAVVEVAKAAGLKVIVSHRSGETNDDFIADFSVAVSADYIKCGAPARGERIAKFNRFFNIERQITVLNAGKTDLSST